MRRCVLAASIVLSFASGRFLPVAAQSTHPLPDSVAAVIDKLYAPMAKAGSPGCSAGVYENGEVVFARGYGYAELVNDVPITPATRFTVGSVSKQFTAASIALLIQAGRISLSDDVRKYIPELQAYPTPVTIATLVHHTSGVRDFWELVDLAGMRPDDGYTSDDMLDLAKRQKGLNFTPGSEYRYSNTGYLLLGEVVRHVTGQSLRRFADSALFKPLGMTSTLFLDDHNEIVPKRASAYQPIGGGYKIDVWNNDIVGQGGIVTTIGDLQKWDENFYTARVGGPEFIKLIQTTEPLTGGKPNDYAFGLVIDTYRGMHEVQHTGSTGGYRAAIFRYPDAHTSVAMLCNVTTANTTALARAMADAVLGPRLGNRTVVARTIRSDTLVAVHPAPPALVKSIGGRYRSDELLGSVWNIVPSAAGTITVTRPRHEAELFGWTTANTFALRGVQLSFEDAVKGKSPAFTLKGDRVQGLRFERIP
jgi:CubicO group peptidase (beta-lactamase class C family)